MLGVLVAVFVVVLLGPSVWRRAFFLARRQVQAELPITLAEIRADRDGLRAEHAVAVSKLEQLLKLERGKTAEQKVTLARQQDELKRIPLLEQNIARLEKRLGEEEKGAAEARQARDTALEKAEILQAELERVQGHYVALESLADTLRIEISAHEAEISRLMSEITEMRHDRKDATARYNELSTQLTAAQTKLKSETRRNGELQQKLEKLISELSDAQEILQAELERVQGHYVALESLADTLRIEISAHEAEISRLMSEITEMRHDRKDATARYNELSTQLTAAQTKLKSETRRNGELQQKLEKLISELSDAQEKLERQNRHGDGALMSADQIEIARQNAALREEMATLAARMVAITAEREGPDSPIHKLLKGTALTEKGKGKKNKAPKSLATRIRDMQ
ncbi:Myosin-14 [Brucella ceti TE28753-12]|nr:Myosin-14 [Brucella ceti TE28753-12]